MQKKIHVQEVSKSVYLLRQLFSLEFYLLRLNNQEHQHFLPFCSPLTMKQQDPEKQAKQINQGKEIPV